MKHFRLTAEAFGDLKLIWEFLAEHSFEAADRILDEFEGAFENLGRMPGMGHRREDLTKQDVLFWSVRSYLVVYEAKSDPIQIVPILHGKRNVERILKNR